MNIERVKELRDRLLQLEEGPIDGTAFYMADWYITTEPRDEFDCGAAACIAGHAALMSPEGKKAIAEAGMSAPVWQIAREWLDLSMITSDALFCPGLGETELRKVTAKQAASVLTALMENPEMGAVQIHQLWRDTATQGDK